MRLASEALARIRSLRSTEPIEFRHFTSKARPRRQSLPLAAERRQAEHSCPEEGGEGRTGEDDAAAAPDLGHLFSFLREIVLLSGSLHRAASSPGRQWWDAEPAGTRPAGTCPR